MTAETILVAVLALAVGALVGWLAADLAAAQARGADADLVRQARDAVERERNAAMQEVAGLRAGAEARDRALAAASAELDAAREGLRQFAALRAETALRETTHADQLRQLGEAREALAQHFAATAAAALETAQKQFLTRADERFRQSEEQSGQSLKAMLQPVEATLKRYEDNLGRIEKEREGSYRELSQAVTQLTQGNVQVVKETQRLANVMRSSPKARGRWGEEQLRTILETAGLSENIDFELQTSVSDGERQLRPDCIVNLPGDRCIVIDVKNIWTAFEAAFEEEDEGLRSDLLRQHAEAMRTTAADLGRKGYWRQFDRSPDFVIMFVPGEHVLAAAAERAPDLIETAFRAGVVIASTINTLALAKIMAGMWRQEALREQAQEIAEVGKELYKRLATMSGHVAKLGRNLALANDGYNAFVGSLESQVYTQARRFEALNVETSGKAIESPPVIEQTPRPLTKLQALDEE